MVFVVLPRPARVPAYSLIVPGVKLLTSKRALTSLFPAVNTLIVHNSGVTIYVSHPFGFRD
jgi:hypothetical protein